MKKLLLLLVAVVGLTLWTAPKAEAYVGVSIGVPLPGFYYGYPYYGYPYYGPGYGYYYGGYYPRYYRRGYYYGPRRAYYYGGRRYYRRGHYARR